VVIVILKQQEEVGAVERTNSWHNRFRKLLVRYTKKLGGYFALVVASLGCCIVICRRIILG